MAAIMATTSTTTLALGRPPWNHQAHIDLSEQIGKQRSQHMRLGRRQRYQNESISMISINLTFHGMIDIHAFTHITFMIDSSPNNNERAFSGFVGNFVGVVCAPCVPFHHSKEGGNRCGGLLVDE